MDERYYIFLATLVALQSQFRVFIEDQPGLITGTNMLEDAWTGLAHSKLTMDLAQLTDIHEQSLELEENLRRTMIEIIRSRDRTSLRRTDILNLQRRLENLQGDVRTAIRNLSGRTMGNYWRGTPFGMKKKEQVKKGFLPRVRSLPNIPSILTDHDFFSDFLKTSKSENRSINFKEELIKDQLQTLESMLTVLERYRIIHTVRNLDKTFSLPDLSTHLHRAKQHLFEEEIEDERFNRYLSSPQGLLRDTVLQDRDENVNRSESQSSTQQLEEDSDDDLYNYRFPVSVQSSPPQQLDEDSDDDLYSVRVSEVSTPVQSSPQGLLWDAVLQDRDENVNRSESQSSTQQLEENSDDDMYSYRDSEVPDPVQSSLWARIRRLFQHILNFWKPFFKAAPPKE